MRPTILLVDDARLFLELEKEFLKHAAVNILTARDGQEVLDTVKVRKPDLIYMDLNMPHLDGAACCTILKQDPDLRSIPVIMVIAAGSAEDVAACTAAGADDIITKPMDRRVFLEKGRRFLPQVDNRETRVRSRLFVVCVVNGESFYGTSEDLSVQGMYISAPYEVEEGEMVEVTIVLPEGGEVVETFGTVAWVNSGARRPKPGLPPGFGVQFAPLSSSAERLLGAYLKNAPSARRHTAHAYVLKNIL
ncbi:MAG TPA: response regulator [Verrucomicrobiae bacterium]|nr:response regulator [Verrucomicrobiae bacterium]